MDPVFTRIRFLICVTALTAASCSPTPPPAPEPHIPAPWSYDGDSGPAHWNKLDPEYATCGFGTTQSPVDITNAKSEDLPAIVFHYQPSRLKIQNTGHTIEVDVAEGNSIEVNGGIYDLVNIRLHAPSEHTIEGKSADAELQLVHRNAAGELVIIAVLLRIGPEDSVLRDVWNNLPPVPGPGKTTEEEIHLEEILPPHRRTWRYEGSLTTPPCAEVASWLVMHDAMHVGAKQLERFTSIFKMNNRPVQPLNHRTILQDSSSDR
jgi:carbonic anhydrase